MARVEVIHADSRDALKELAENSVDSVVTDPPYALVSITKRFGADNAAPCKAGKTGAYQRASAGFMGKKWDTGETAFDPDFWREVLRVLKPGAHLAAFGGTRTYHRLACAIEDAGFEIRDQLAWIFGSGFPKSRDVAKGIDKALGAEREKVRIDVSRVRNPTATGGGRDGTKGATRPWIEAGLKRGYNETASDEPASDEAAQWRGWGTGLKPAHEPIVLARKPMIGTVAANVMKHGTGALNIDACRIGVEGGTSKSASKSATVSVGGFLNATAGDPIDAGRWPANLVHDGSEEVLAGFPQTKSGGAPTAGNRNCEVFGEFAARSLTNHGVNEGSAARFFYTAKADASDRLNSRHPTVKPVDLMAWLVRLVTKPGGTILDPFAGSGTTGMACLREGFDAILIEREAEYVADIRRRIEHVSGHDTPLFVGANATDTPPARAVPFTECSRTKNRTDGIKEVAE